MIEDLAASQRRALARLGPAPVKRKPRSDRGRSRFPAEVVDEVARLATVEGLPPGAVWDRVRDFCTRRGHAAPSRASVYQLLRMSPLGSFDRERLPSHVVAALYNLDGVSRIPAEQVAFYCFNYGDHAAMSYASALPTSVLVRALALRGWRPMSRAVAEAVLRVRRSDARRRAGDPARTA